MARATYKEEWKKFFERMGQHELPLLNKVGTKALLFDVKRKYRGENTVLVVSSLTKRVNAQNEPEAGYEQMRFSEKDGFRCVTIYFVPTESGKPMEKLYATGVKGEMGAIIDYTQEGHPSYSFRYSNEKGFSKVEKFESKEANAEKPAEVVEETAKKKRPKRDWIKDLPWNRT